ncbi:MAG: fibrobacter succinogenes major paralogous domain-containing protein [Bacteroidales bacterium]|nr:fibrobacter succinogenes major paralogous domain-containing protein [Bacteroidales bacterium]
MKKNFTIRMTLIFTLFTSILFAQAPDKLNYQAVIRDSNNKLLSNKQVSLKISVLEGEAKNVVYTENISSKTNENGLVSAMIGTGTSTDKLNTIDWQSGNFYIKVEIDPENGINYSISSINPLGSVPFAFYANISGKTNDPELELAKKITATDTISWNKIKSLKTDTLVIVLRDTLYNFTSSKDTIVINNSSKDTVVINNVTTHKDTVVINNITSKIDTVVINNIDTLIISKKDTVIVNNVTSKIDTIVVNNYDTTVIATYDTTVIATYDTVIVAADTVKNIYSQKDTVYITQKDTVYLAVDTLVINNVVTQKDTVFVFERDTIVVMTDSLVMKLTRRLDDLEYFMGLTAIDFDGNAYDVIRIGNQFWLDKNLMTTKYDNGEPLVYETLYGEWSKKTVGAYCAYNNVKDSALKYGYLYNFHAVTDARNICPKGFHVPTDTEWITLINFIGADTLSGARLKETGTEHWKNPNAYATNEFGFTALPGGFRNFDGTYGLINTQGSWWSSTQATSTTAFYRDVYNKNGLVFRNSGSKNIGYSVRCIKN